MVIHVDTLIDIPGYEGLYAACSSGRIWSHSKTSRLGRTYPGRILSPALEGGYFRVSLSKEGKTRSFLVHRLVALAHLPNPEGLPEINHKDGNKENCALSNLEWVTGLSNRLHAVQSGLLTHKRLSKFHGVSYSVQPIHRLKPWRAQIQIEGKQKQIGYYNSEVAAAKAFNDFVISNSLPCVLNNLPPETLYDFF